MLYRITSGLIARRGIALGVLLAITAGLGVFAARVGIDNNVGVWFVEGDPTLASYQRFQDTFGNDEVVAIAAVTDRKGGVWTSEYLNKIRTLTARLEKVEGVSRVLSVSNAQLLGLHSDGEGGQALGVAPVMPGEVVDADLARLRTLVETDPILKDTFVVSEGRVAMVFAQMAVADKFDSVRPGVLTGIQDVLDDSGLTTHVAGIGVIYNALNQIAQVEGAVFMGLAFLLVFALLWPLFRSVPAVLASIGAVACAVVMTRGLYGLAGRDENMVTMTLPVLVLILGVADCVHIFRYRASRPDEDPARVLADILKPCIFTTLTTMVGFAALATSKMALVRDLGIFAAAGIGLAVVSSTVMAAFVMGRPGFRVKPPSKPGEGLMGRFLAWTARFAVGNKETVLGITCLVILLAGYGISLIQVDTYSLGYLDESHPVRAASEAMEKAAGPFTPLEILVRGEKSEAIVDPTVLRGIHAFQAALEKDPQVRSTFSIADVVARLHQVQMGEGEPFEVPDDAAMVADNVEIYKSDPDGKPLTLVDDAWKTARVTASVPVLSAQGYRQLVDRVRVVAKDHLPDSVTIEPSGYLPLYTKMMDYIVESQVKSFGLAFVAVFILIGLLFGSIRMTALAVLPNVFPVFVTLGVMGVLGINLDVATVTITSVIMGIVVDDTIHYLHRFRDELRANDGDFTAASHATALGCGRSIGATTLIFSLGFMVLGLASIKSIVYFGLLTSLSMVVALIGDLFILPAVLVALQPKL